MKRPLAIALVLIGSAAACRFEAPTTSGGSALVIGLLTTGVTLDPHRHDSYQTHLTLSHFYDKLVTLGPDLEVRPELATTWENPRENVLRLHLRHGVVFHDGRPFGAPDVVASLSRARAKESELRHYLQTVEDVRAVDEATVDLVTRSPSAVLLTNLVFVSIVPRDTGEAVITHPVGTGPYVFAGGKPGGRILGKRFDRYWAATKPSFDRVTFLPLPEAAARAEAVASGRADVVVQFPADAWEEASRRRKAKMVSLTGGGALFLGFSTRPGSPFADVRVRRAVALALDREELARDGMHGLGVPLEQMVPPGVFGFVGDLGPMPHDASAATVLMKQAGLSTGLDVPLLVPDAVASVGVRVARQLASIGIVVRLDPEPQDEFYRRISHGDFPFVLLGWNAANGDASSSLGPLVHSPGDGWGTFNRWGYSNPEVDRLIEESDRTLDPNLRRPLLASVMRALREDLPIIPLVTRRDLYALRSDLTWTPAHDRIQAVDLKRATP